MTIRCSGVRRKRSSRVLLLAHLFQLMVKTQALRWWVSVLLVCLWTAQRSFAQTDTLTPRLTQSVVPLSAVTVHAIAPERFLAGQKLQRIDSITLRQFQFGSLTDLLALNTPLAFKNYGPGQLATVAFRGTSANHTAVLWNGININQPNLGQTDFSTLPVAGFNRVAVQYGSSASAVGSGAVGGSILLSTSPNWQSGIRLTLGRQIASFHNNQTQAGLQYGTSLGQSWKIAGRTYAYRTQLNNVYPYAERHYYPMDRSTTGQRGFTQDLFFLHKSGRQVSVNAWVTDNDLILAPQDSIARERTRTQSARWLATYETNRMSFRLGWIRDVLDYAKSDFSNPSHTQTERLIARVEREFQLLPTHTYTLTLRTGGEWSHYWTRTDGYGGQLIQEDRGDLYALLRFQTNRWLATANVRQAFITHFNPPLTPSLGIDYQLIQHTRFTLTTKGAISRSYRVPTLNERYWIELGNPTLLPEDGLNMEAGVSVKGSLAGGLVLTADVTGYHNRVTNWTYWNPSRNYHVENLQLVVARGIEINAGLAHNRGSWQTGARINYALTRSSQERVYDAYANDIVGKQLVYVPIHTGTLNAYVQRLQTRLSLQLQANSRQYITFDNSQFFKGTLVANVLLEHTIHWRSASFRAQGQINNIVDALLLSVKQTALPGRNWAINVLINSPFI